MRFSFTRILVLAALGTLMPALLVAQVLTDGQRRDLDAWYRTARRRAPGEWGIAIANQRGQVLWSVNPEASLAPASTVKIFTTGFARTLLGGNARIETRVLGSGYIDPMSGEWMGQWALELNGDPSLENPDSTGPRLSDLARQLAALGIRRLGGPLEVRSADGPAEARYPDAWSRHHWGRLFAPLIGMLTLHENVVWVTVAPGSRVGSKGILIDDAPHGIAAMVQNTTRTVSGHRTRVHIAVAPGRRLGRQRHHRDQCHSAGARRRGTGSQAGPEVRLAGGTGGRRHYLGRGQPSWDGAPPGSPWPWPR